MKTTSLVVVVVVVVVVVARYLQEKLCLIKDDSLIAMLMK